MAINSTQEDCDSYTVVAFPEDDNTVSLCELPVSLSSSMEDYVLIKSQLSMSEQPNYQTYSMKTVEIADAYSECIEKDVDIEKGNSETETRGIDEETAGNLKMNHNLILPKFSVRDKTASEKLVEAPRMRKFKRSASFNSRKVVLLFSILSSLGTIILIYLTLRVKQIGDAFST